MNSVNLIGRLVRDPEFKIAGDTQVTTFTIAIDRPKKLGEQKADYPRIVCFGKMADNVNQHIKKGDRVGISGVLQTGSYKTSDGTTRYTVDVVATWCDFLEKKREVSEQTLDNEDDQPF